MNSYILNELGSPRGINIIQVNGYVMVLISTRDVRKINEISDGSSGQIKFQTIESMI